MNRNFNDFNETKTRNRNNTPYYEYNCGGFALETYSWYVPYTRDNRINYDVCDIKENREKVMKISIDTILKEIKGIRLIKDLKELKENEYAIAYRFKLGFDSDFHFLKRGRNGVWYEKMGGMEGISTIKKKDFEKPWHHRYNSEIALFAKVF